MTGVAVLTVVLVLAPLVAIFGYLVYRGFGSINWAFLTQTPKPVGEPGGGMANAIVGIGSDSWHCQHHRRARSELALEFISPSLAAIALAAQFVLPPMC